MRIGRLVRVRCCEVFGRRERSLSVATRKSDGRVGRRLSTIVIGDVLVLRCTYGL